MPFGTITSILLIIGGIIVSLVGKFLLRLVVGIAAGGILGYFIAKLVLIMNGGLMAALLLGFLGFIIGFFLGWFIVKLALSVVTGIALGIVVAGMLGFINNLGLLILTVLVLIAISYILSEKILTLLLMIVGSAMVYLGFTAFVQPLIAAIIAVIEFIIVAYLKLRK